MKRLPELMTFAKAHKLRIVSIADLIQYRQRFEKLVSRVDSFEVQLGDTAAQGIVYATPSDSIRHVALCIGDLRREPVAVRIHREGVFDDVFGAVGSGREQLLAKALQTIRGRGTGVIVYLRSAEGYMKLPEWQQSESPRMPVHPLRSRCGRRSGARSESAPRSCAISASAASSCWPRRTATMSASTATASPSPRRRFWIEAGARTGAPPGAPRRHHDVGAALCGRP